MNGQAMTEEGRLTNRELLIRWLLSQGVSTVLLILILVAMGYGGNYGMNVAIPAHLDAIQKGYDRMQAAHSSEIVKLTETFERTLDRIELHLERRDKAAKTTNGFPPRPPEPASDFTGS